MSAVRSAEDLAATIDRYESFVRADPGNALLWLNLGNLYHRAAKLEEAGACFERCLHDHPEVASARSQLASVRISQNKFDEAERMLRPLLQDAPEGDADPALLFNLGLSLYYQRRWVEAERWFMAAAGRGVGTPQCYAYLARCRHWAGDMEQATEYCQRWVNAARDAESRGYLALLHMDRGDIAEAHRLAQEVLVESPDDSNAAVVAATAAIEGQEIAEASEQFQRVLVREPENARAWLGLGLACLYQQHHPEAITALERASGLVPDSVGIRVTLGWAIVAAREVRRAEEVFRDAIATDRNFGEAHGGLAVALALQMRVDEAREEIRRARGLDPHGFGAVFAHSIILKLQGQHEQATDILANLLQQAPRPDGKTLMEQIEMFLRKNPPPPGRALEDPRKGAAPSRPGPGS